MLNIEGSELSAVTRHRMRGLRIGDLEELRQEVRAADVNDRPRGVGRQMTDADAPSNLTSHRSCRFCDTAALGISPCSV